MDKRTALNLTFKEFIQHFKARDRFKGMEVRTVTVQIISPNVSDLPPCLLNRKLGDIPMSELVTNCAIEHLRKLRGVGPKMCDEFNSVSKEIKLGWARTKKEFEKRGGK